MDPLSLIASILTVIGAGRAAIEAIRRIASLKRTLDVVLGLNNELSNLRLVVSTIENGFQTHRTSGVSIPNSRINDIAVETTVANALKQVNSKVLELQALHDKLIKPSSATNTLSTVKLKKIIWLADHRESEECMKIFAMLGYN